MPNPRTVTEPLIVQSVLFDDVDITLPEHLVPHPLQGALYCIGCSLACF